MSLYVKLPLPGYQLPSSPQLPLPGYFFRDSWGGPGDKGGMTAPRQIIPGTTQFGARLAAAVKAKAAELAAEREAQGKSFLGREAVLAQSPFDRPGSDDERGDLDPKVACREKFT